MKHIVDSCTKGLGQNNTDERPMLIWESENDLKIDDVSFKVETGNRMEDARSRDKVFVLGKSRRQLECIQELQMEKPVRYIFDLGIYKGGSVMFYFKYFNPKKLVAIELNTDPVAALDDYIEEHQLDEVIRTHYGIDQSDEKAMHKIVREEMRGQPIDMIVDDASHFLRETRASFNILFPYLAAGGYYIIEDWGWAHWPGEHWQRDGGPWSQDPPLTNLIFELTMLAASRSDLVDSIYLRPAYAVIRKGQGACEPGNFNLSSSYANRGKPVNLLS